MEAVFKGFNGGNKKKMTNPYLIITTKQERYVRAIMEAKGLPCPQKKNIYDLENPYGSKVKVLEALTECKLPYGEDIFELSKTATPVCENHIHFVEDRYETLLAIQASALLVDNVHLYLVGKC